MILQNREEYCLYCWKQLYGVYTDCDLFPFLHCLWGMFYPWVWLGDLCLIPCPTSVYQEISQPMGVYKVHTSSRTSRRYNPWSRTRGKIVWHKTHAAVKGAGYDQKCHQQQTQVPNKSHADTSFSLSHSNTWKCVILLAPTLTHDPWYIDETNVCFDLVTKLK